MQRFEDQTVIVTGGGREAGVSHARGFAAEGAKVVIAGVLKEECRWLEREMGNRALFTPLDVTNEEQWDATVLAAEQAFGPVSVLVNNAGLPSSGRSRASTRHRGGTPSTSI